MKAKAAAPREVIVRVADWAAERHDAVIVTLGLGSCVAIRSVGQDEYVI